MWRDLNQEEQAFLSEEYSALSDEERASLTGKLTYIHTGEMVPYYIMRYGFYEGHTSYRADPIAVAFIVCLRSLHWIERAFGGKLVEALTEHHLGDGTSREGRR